MVSSSYMFSHVRLHHGHVAAWLTAGDQANRTFARRAGHVGHRSCLICPKAQREHLNPLPYGPRWTERQPWQMWKPQQSQRYQTQSQAYCCPQHWQGMKTPSMESPFDPRPFSPPVFSTSPKGNRLGLVGSAMSFLVSQNATRLTKRKRRVRYPPPSHVGTPTVRSSAGIVALLLLQQGRSSLSSTFNSPVGPWLPPTALRFS